MNSSTLTRDWLPIWCAVRLQDDDDIDEDDDLDDDDEDEDDEEDDTDDADEPEPWQV